MRKLYKAIIEVEFYFDDDPDHKDYLSAASKAWSVGRRAVKHEDGFIAQHVVSVEPAEEAP